MLNPQIHNKFWPQNQNKILSIHDNFEGSKAQKILIMFGFRFSDKKKFKSFGVFNLK